MTRKGIILAGGHGTRLYPMTQTTSKHLLAVYDKPMIYYPITTLMMSGIKDILIIGLPRDLPAYQTLFGDGSQWGVHFSYQVQTDPRGLAEAFILGETFLDGEAAALILGDNIFYGNALAKQLQSINANTDQATIFAYRVNNPSAYGVVAFDKAGQATHIEEKPKTPKSHYAIPGLYFFDQSVCEIAKTIQPSARGELEITDIHNTYLQQNKLHVEKLGRGVAWFDSGTPSSLMETSQFIETIENRQGIKIGCPEEIALRMNFITKKDIEHWLSQTKSSHYRDYIETLLEEIDE